MAPRTKYVIVAVVLAIVVVVGAVVVVEKYRSAPASPSSSVTLAPAGWSAYSLPYQQFGDIPFVLGTTNNITGAFESTNLISVYIVTSVQFAPLLKDQPLPGWEWTSGQVWQGNISYTIPPGSWDLVFLNTNPYGASSVGITTPVVLTPV
jgi:hypothetical protein